VLELKFKHAAYKEVFFSGGCICWVWFFSDSGILVTPLHNVIFEDVLVCDLILMALPLLFLSSFVYRTRCHFLCVLHLHVLIVAAYCSGQRRWLDQRS